MKKFLLALALILIATAVPAHSAVLRWDPCNNCEAYQVSMDGAVVADNLLETELSLDDLSLVEGQSYLFEVRGIDNRDGSLQLLGPATRLDYVHHEPRDYSQDISSPADARIVIDVNVNINQKGTN